MTLTRTVRPGRLAVAVVLAGLAAGGCGKPAAPPQPAGGAPDSGRTPKGESQGTTPPAPAEATSIEAFARDFLKAVNDGTATPAMVAPQFKKLAVPPVFASDRALGYSDERAAAWLAGLKGKLPAPTLGTALGGGEAAGYVVAGTGPDGPYTATLRVVQDKGWKADWLLVTPAAAEGPVPAATGDAGFGAFAAAAFLHALTAKTDALTAGLMTPALKAKLAPAVFDSDKDLGYTPTLLAGKLADLRGPAAGFRLTKADAGAATGELVKGGPGKPVALKLTKGDRPWDRLVDDIEGK